LTTQAGAKIVPALRVVTEKAPLMSTDGLYAGAPGRCAPVCVARHLFRITKGRSSCLDWRFFSSQQRRRWKI